MALNNAAADEALDLWVASMVPPPADGGIAIKASMRPMFRAIFAKIVEHAEISLTISPPSAVLQ